MHTESTRRGYLYQIKVRFVARPSSGKGKYVNETFLCRKDAEEWALDIERQIDRQEPATARSRDAKLVGDIIALHRRDLEDVGKRIGRSKDASLDVSQ